MLIRFRYFGLWHGIFSTYHISFIFSCMKKNRYGQFLCKKRVIWLIKLLLSIKHFIRMHIQRCSLFNFKAAYMCNIYDIHIYCIYGIKVYNHSMFPKMYWNSAAAGSAWHQGTSHFQNCAWIQQTRTQHDSTELGYNKSILKIVLEFNNRLFSTTPRN